MEGLAFLKDMAEQQDKIIAQNKELLNLYKAFLAKPPVAPIFKVDNDQIVKQIVNSGMINKASEDLKPVLFEFIRVANQIPKNVYIKGEFYGFTGWKPFALYMLFLISGVGFGTYSWYRNSDNPTIARMQKNRDILDERINNLIKNNPKTGSKYFPEYK